MNEENIYRNPIIYADVPDMDIIRSKDREGRQAFLHGKHDNAFVTGSADYEIV